MSSFPDSLADFRANELPKVPLNLGDAFVMSKPVSVRRPVSLATSLVRLVGPVHLTDLISRHLRYDLCLVLSCYLFEMSYERDYIVWGEERQEIGRQVDRGLNGFRK